MTDVVSQAVTLIYRDRRLAHRDLFAHRHPNATPPFHDLLIDDWHSREQRIAWVVFRGGGKSTIGEEGLIIGACLREYRHGLILAASLERAVERLHAIRREFEKNHKVNSLWGPCRGRPWGDDLIELPWGVTIRAMGRGQSLRGTKEETVRPDLIFADDIEDAISVSTESGRKKVQDWFLLEVLPAADPTARVRLAANMLDPECLAKKLQVPKSGFKVRVIPWEHTDGEGRRAASWPGRFPLEQIDDTREMYYALGNARGYNMEYMCKAEHSEQQIFTPQMKRLEPRVRLWEPVYCMFDPARTISHTAATTGFAAWSWIGGRLIIWDLWAKKLLPDEIFAAIFAADEEFSPIKIGFEIDGLEEWARQPLREMQRKRGKMLPLEGVRAPRGKIDFIRALQPWFASREATFAKDCPEAWSQFLSFPGGHIDAPNALAYCLHAKLKTGLPFYEDFSPRHVEPETYPTKDDIWLAMNADGAIVTGVLVQWLDRRIVIHNDWVMEGDSGQVAAALAQAASFSAQRSVKITVPREQYEKYSNSGLTQALRKGGFACNMGGSLEAGRTELRGLLASQRLGFPAFRVASKARSTINAFSGGYCHAESRGVQRAVPYAYAEPGNYKVLMEGLESFAGLLRLGSDVGVRANATTSAGIEYYSTRPQVTHGNER